jgi:carbon-monoxide dehydrogenase medium subunit
MCPVLAETAAEIGDPQVRNKGTLGGSLAHADPSADYPATMIALDAEIMIAGRKGSRTVKAADFFIDLFTVDLAANELITGVKFTPVRSAAYAEAAPTRVALRDRRCGSGVGRGGRCHQVGPAWA